MIPKVIHYCWFGGNSKPEFVQKCIESWKQYCPEYKIVEWNEAILMLIVLIMLSVHTKIKSGLLFLIMLDYGLFTIMVVYI